MMFSDGRRPNMPAQFSLRVAILGAFALVIFSAIFFRLWYLEILSGDRYLAEAQNNQVRAFTVEAPRGEIVDRNGELLVDNRVSLALQIRTAELPKLHDKRAEVFQNVSRIADISPEQIRKQIRVQTREAPASPVTLKRDVSYELVYFVRENQEQFPGVSVDRVFVRRYPQGTLAAHVLGYVREVSPEELKDPRFDGLDPGDNVGKSGVERTYDAQIRGVNGVTRVAVDATGSPTGRPLSTKEPQPGNDLRLSLDSELQRVAEQALGAEGLGAFAALDVHTGEILALGSNPSFDPSLLARPVITPEVSAQVFGTADSLAPAAFFNRAIAGAYPTGSTFKPITAIAGLSSGAITPSEVVSDGGSVRIGDITFSNAGGVANGAVDMVRALQVSSDVYFYLLGQELDTDSEPLQQWATQLGLGGLTGIDIPGEASGLVPSPEWRNELYKDGDTDRPWTVGDNVNLAVGQGDLQAAPLQMATAYAAIANGGDVVRPHVGMRVEDPTGRVLQEIDPPPRRHVDIDPAWRQTIMDGLHRAAMEPGGTSYGIFGGFPVDIAGKTGTAETTSGYDQSWYVALAPYPNPEIAVAVTVERGGFGADSAAPATARILEQYFDFSQKKIGQIRDASAATAAAANVE